MARKLELDSAISADFKAASADSFADNIKMLDVSELIPSSDNFYELSNLELLADDIEREGLKHNLVVAKEKGTEKYMIISGHRRFEAIKFLINEKRLSSTKIPCYVEGEMTRPECNLNVIMLNATQRKYTDSDMLMEYEKLTETLKELDNEGKGLKGRIRENIARILKVSTAQVGKIDNIKHNAVPEVEKAVKSGEMSISTANEVAKLTPEKQKEVISSKPASKITNKAVKQIQQEKKAPPAETKKIDAPVYKPAAETKSPYSVKKVYTFTEEEAQILLKYISDLFSLCSDEDEEILEKIRKRLEA